MNHQESTKKSKNKVASEMIPLKDLGWNDFGFRKKTAEEISAAASRKVLRARRAVRRRTKSKP